MITSAIIFLHGLGDTSAGWSFLEPLLKPHLPNTAFIFPDAPSAPVTCNGGYESTSWFDIARIPLDEREPEGPAGLQDSVASLTALIDETRATHNLPVSSIIVGGFSQGGAMSLITGGGYRCKESGEGVGGVICLSGWALERSKNVANWGEGGMSNTPLFVGHGSADQVVLTSLGKNAFEAIREKRKGSSGDMNSVEKIYPGEGHGACEAELVDLTSFITSILKK